MQFLFPCPVIGQAVMHESNTEADFELENFYFDTSKVMLIQLLFAIQTKQHRT